MYHIKNYQELIKSILSTEWKALPMQVDIPSNSQILGQLVYQSKIEGILYPSQKGREKKCLAIYVNNFENSAAFVRIIDEVPPNVVERVLNSETFEKLK